VTKSALALVFLSLLLAPALPGATHGGGLSGTWIAYSARIDYDGGRGGAVMTPGTQRLVISGTRWKFGASSGTVALGRISAADWKRWGVTSYGPTRKATFVGWNRGRADGPVEEEASRVDFVWVLYRAKPPLVRSPATISLKFGRLGNR
jgi:hypothetical protein